jgi:hypothetical protein
MSVPGEIAKKRRWPLLGVIVGPFVVAVPVVVFVVATLALQRDMASGGSADPRHTLEQARLMSYAAVAMLVLVPLGAGAFIFSVMRLAKLRRQTPPKLPPAIPPAPGEPT